MELLKTLFVKALSFAGFNIPDVAKDDLGAMDVDETSEERKSRFAAFADAEEEVKEEAAEDAAIIKSVAITGDGWDAIHGFIAEGKKVNAIIAYREMTGAGLMEAKEAIDPLYAEREVA